MLHDALALAEHGWHVFPLRPSGKEPATAHGLLDATTDEATIRAWWDQTPEANIGVRTGAESGLLVLDVDAGDKGGVESLATLLSEHGDLPATCRAHTGGGGEHILFQHPGGEVRNSTGRLGRGIDVRGDGGYIVVPPSVHPSGEHYAWLHGGPFDPEPPPKWLLDLLATTLTKTAPATEQEAEGTIPEGQRNSKLASLAGSMRRRGMSLDGISAALQAENQSHCDPPLDEEEVERIAGSIGSYPPAPPRDGGWPTTDLGNAERLVARHGADLRHVSGRGWHCWDGRRWKRDGDGAMRRAKLSARATFAEAEHADDDEGKRIVQWAEASEHSLRLAASVELAKSELPLIVSADELDADPWLLCVENGTLDLRTGELREHRREDNITKLAPVVYDPQASSAAWDSFVLESCGYDFELAAFLQRATGYSVAGSTTEEVLFFVHGPGATGKSTLIETVKAMLGDYAVTADFDTFLKRRSDRGIPSDVARLAGARLVAGVEVEDGKSLAEGLVKQLTGGDVVTARFMYKEFFEFKPLLKLWLVANSRPAVRAEDTAMWRRILQVPFVHVVPPDKRDEGLKRRLRQPEHLSAALAWAVEGCLRWQERGLGVPESVRAYTEEYRAEADPFQMWLDEDCLVDAEFVCEAGVLRAKYESWCRANGGNPVAARTWSRKLHALGCSRKRDTGGGRLWRWRGIDLAP
jgi:putative DNA primase/helicase